MLGSIDHVDTTPPPATYTQKVPSGTSGSPVLSPEVESGSTDPVLELEALSMPVGAVVALPLLSAAVPLVPPVVLVVPSPLPSSPHPIVVQTRAEFRAIAIATRAVACIVIISARRDATVAHWCPEDFDRGAGAQTCDGGARDDIVA
ncbi:MAG: hypothetical protein K0V04_25655 [Deltaproteobacteria bacterium]|nr:hypothetical protein [Deltaproteobacteria bacterium]